jgi:hypothetical protein
MVTNELGPSLETLMEGHGVGYFGENVVHVFAVREACAAAGHEVTSTAGAEEMRLGAVG